MPRRDESLETLRQRLAEWQMEQQTNKHGMAHMAERSIAVLLVEIARKSAEQEGVSGTRSPQ